MLKEIISHDNITYFVDSDLDFDKFFHLSADRHSIFHVDELGAYHILAFYFDSDLCIHIFNEFREYFSFSDFLRYKFPLILELEGDLYHGK